MIHKLVTRVIQYFCFPDRTMNGGDILDFQKQGNFQKRRRVDLKKGDMTPLTNYGCALSKLVYTFTFRYSLASTAFPKATISVVCTESQLVQTFIFPNGKLIFPN